jgi:hypothetical protein
MLRFRDSQNLALLALRHRSLRAIAPDILLPASLAEEAANKLAADGAYEACVSVLRTRTRDHHKFPLVFEENCDYGFRRNLFGLRSWGVAALLAGCAAVGIRVWSTSDMTALQLAAAAVMLGQGFLWLTVVNEDWVRRAADTYAARLLEAGIELAPAHRQ